MKRLLIGTKRIQAKMKSKQYLRQKTVIYKEEKLD